MLLTSYFTAAQKSAPRSVLILSAKLEHVYDLLARPRLTKINFYPALSFFSATNQSAGNGGAFFFKFLINVESPSLNSECRDPLFYSFHHKLFCPVKIILYTLRLRRISHNRLFSFVSPKKNDTISK